MKKYLWIIAIICLGCKSNQIKNSQKMNVLFIGNSLTYYHDMPKMLHAMLIENYSNYNIEQSTFSGMSLDSHLKDIITEKKDDNITTRLKESGELTETEKKLQEKKWDILILQEHPGYYYFPEVIEEYTKPSIDRILEIVNNKECKVILYKTWVNKKKYPFKIDCINKSSFDYIIYPIETNKEEFCAVSILDRTEENKFLNVTIESIAKQFNGISSNHLNLHNTIYEKFPEISLYEEDGHPNENGSFINALEFYRVITNKNPKKLKSIGNLDAKTAQKLKNLF